MKVCVFLGPPGAGKGTQSEMLDSRLGCQHISTGTVIRREIQSGTALGRSVKALVEGGALVDDETLFKCLEEALKGLEGVECLLLDGVPRTVSQVALLDHSLSRLGLKIDVAVALKAPLERLISRFASRWTCKNCNSVSTFENIEARNASVCPKCKASDSFMRRADDAPEAVRKRLEIYESETASLVSVFSKRGILVEVPADQIAERVYVDVAHAILHFTS